MTNSQSENLKDKISDKPQNGGARAGAGRPKGSMNPDTKLRVAAKAEFQRRVARKVAPLFNAQFDLAIGEKYLMVKHVDYEDGKKKVSVEVVTNIDLIKQYIDDDGVSLNEGEDYYYMSVKPANNQALDSLLNRAFGKADESLDLTSGGDKLNNYSSLSDEEITTRIEEYLARRKK